MPEQKVPEIPKMPNNKVADSSETETQTEDANNKVADSSETETQTEDAQPEAQPESQPEAPPETPEKPKKGFCSCFIVEKYKKPMGTMVVILLLILNTIMVFVGIIQCYSSPCPIEPIIPIYLVGAGIIGIVCRIILIVKHYRNIENVIINRTLYGLLIAELLFLIIGSSWIFSNFQKKQYSCNGAAFTWAFLILIFNYIILLSPIFIPCGIETYHCCFPQESSTAP